MSSGAQKSSAFLPIRHLAANAEDRAWINVEVRSEERPETNSSPTITLRHLCNRLKLLRRESGQALVELALAVPLLLFVLFGIIDFGLAINQYNNTTNLANLGARATAVLSSSNATPGKCTYTGPSGIATTYTTLVGYVDCEGAIEGSLSQTSVKVCDPNSTATITTGDSVSVQVASDFRWLGVLTGGVGRIGGVVGPSTMVGSAATMRMEGSSSVSSSSGTWFGPDGNPAPGATTGTIAAPTIATSGC